jgi:hypothetical protein
VLPTITVAVLMSVPVIGAPARRSATADGRRCTRMIRVSLRASAVNRSSYGTTPIYRDRAWAAVGGG